MIQTSHSDRLPRIAIAGIHIESSTFTPYRSSAADFEVLRGEDVLGRYPFLPALQDQASWHGVLHARALPGGPVVAADYDGWRDEIVQGLAGLHAEEPLDGVLLDIHGAMSVVGIDDAEGDLATALRAALGPEVLIAAPMDLHGNVSDALFSSCDLLTCYRTAPHVDTWETRERSARHLLEAIAALPEGRPVQAVVHVPILLPGEMTSTRIEPAASLYARIPELAAREGVRDVSYWIGFAWADEPRCEATILAHGTDAEAASAAALELANAVWEARHEFAFVAPTGTFEECLTEAVASSERPFWISDSGDNPGAGGADDTTHCLDLLRRNESIRSGETSALMVSLVDPAAAAAAWEAGIGGSLRTDIGGHIDARDPGPLDLEVQVDALDEDTGTGRAAALRVLDDGRETGLIVVVTSRRAQYSRREMFERLDLDMRGVDVVTVKMGYLEPDQYEAATDWRLALTPGGVDQDLQRLGHSRIHRPMIPFDAEIPRPTAAQVR